MADFLYRDRLRLSPYCQAIIGLALHELGQLERRDMIIRNLSQFVERDNENQTIRLRLGSGYRWSWYGNHIEANALYLRLLCRIGKAGFELRRLGNEN